MISKTSAQINRPKMVSFFVLCLRYISLTGQAQAPSALRQRASEKL